MLSDQGLKPRGPDSNPRLLDSLISQNGRRTLYSLSEWFCVHLRSVSVHDDVHDYQYKFKLSHYTLPETNSNLL